MRERERERERDKERETMRRIEGYKEDGNTNRRRVSGFQIKRKRRRPDGDKIISAVCS